MRQRFIQSFSTSGDVQTAVDNKELGMPYVAYVEDGQYIDWNSKGVDYAAMPLTFEIISGGTIGFTSPIGVTIEYSADNGQTWGDFSSIEVEAGDRIMFRGTGRTATADDNSKSSNFTSTNGAKLNIVGNINSLLDKTNYTGITNLTSYGSYTFLRLFAGLDGLVSAENLVLPATTLVSYCYGKMFSMCRNLTKTPKLPATTLANNSYQMMFSNCTGLTTAPALPATTLADGCYGFMFDGCKSLATAPELPATILAPSCYYGMLQGCTSLTTAPAIPATTLAERCYQSMFARCASLRTAPELPATTLAEYCYGGMFQGCASLTTAPELPATTLANGCYNSMFQSCTSLTTAPALPAENLTFYCYGYMFKGCTKLTTAQVLPATTLAGNCYTNMFNGCTSLNYIKCLATNISAESCTSSWVGSVASSGTFVKNASMTGWTTGSDGIPTNWTVVNADI